MRLFILILFFLAIKLSAQQTGDLDFTFGTNGKTISSISSSDFDAAAGIALQDDGKIVVVGAALFSDTQASFAIARYNSDGTLDNSFDFDGKVVTSFDTTLNGAFDVVIQSDGKILVAGVYADIFLEKSGLLLARYNTDGSLDATFSGDGKMQFNIANNLSDNVYSVAIQNDGKILIGGTHLITANTNDLCIIRFNTDGTLDNSFGFGGVFSLAIPAMGSGITALKLQTDGKIVASGWANSANSFNFLTIRCNSGGTLDNSFGNAGISITSMSTSVSNINAIGIQNDGKIVIGGRSNYQFALVRYNSDGSLDNSFGIGGKVLTIMTVGGFNTAEISDLIIESDGKILVTGDTTNNVIGFSKYVLARYEVDGTLDSSFSGDGKIIDTWEVATSCGAKALITQTDGKILVVGTTDDGNSSKFTVARYLNDINIGIIDFSLPVSEVFIYPNPVLGTTTISYTLKNSETLSIELLDMQGKRLYTFADKLNKSAGRYEELITLPNEIGTGLYFVMLSSLKRKVLIKIIKN